LFSSQVPFSFSSKDFLKFVEVHHEFFRHEWLHDIKLGDWNRSITCPAGRLSSPVMKYAEFSSAAKTAIFIINWNKTKNRIILDVFSISAISSTTVMYCHWVWLLQLMSLYYITFYCIDSGILLENRPLVKFIRNYIRNSSGVFSYPTRWGYRRRHFPLLHVYCCLCKNTRL